MARSGRRRPLPGVAYPVQERSWRTFDQLLDAAEELLEEGSLETLRVEHVLERTGISNGSFYARFDSREALLSALVDRFRLDSEDALAEIEDALPPGADLAERVGLFVDLTLRRFQERRGMLRALTLYYRLHADRGVDLLETARELNRRVVAFFWPARGEIAARRKEEAILRGTYYVTAIVRDRVLFERSPHASTVPVPGPAFARDLRAILLCILTGAG